MKWSFMTIVTLAVVLTTSACTSTPATPASEETAAKESTNKASKPIPTNPGKVVKKGANININTYYTPYKESDVVDFKSRMAQANTILIDVRTPAEFKKRTLDGARNINVLNGGLFNKEVTKLDKDKTYLLFGATGMRSMRAARTMSEMGFKNIYSLTGGLGAWDRVNKELEKK